MSGSHRRQTIGSLIAAVLIVAVAVAVVTAQFGPTSAAQREAAEDRREQRQERLEDRRERREERLEERRERRDERR